MRIGLIISQLRSGGGSYQLLHLARELKKMGNEVYIYTLDDTLSKKEPHLTAGLTIKSCHFSDKTEESQHSQLVGFILHIIYLLRITFLLAKKVAKDNLDLLNPHEWPMQWVGVLIKIKKRMPVVWMCNDVWHIPGNEEYPEKRILFYLGNRLIGVADQFLTRFIDRIIVLDQRIALIAKNYYHKEPVVIRSGIDLAEFKNLPKQEGVRRRLGLTKEDFIFLCLSIFTPHRRFEDAIMAFKKLKFANRKSPIRLLIVGSDAYDKRYAELIKKLVLENDLEKDTIIRRGFIKEADLLDYLVSCNCFVFPNERQTWGLIAVEAMASGKPCIVSDEAGVHEIIENGENGLVFHARDRDDLADKMKLVLENCDLREYIGKKAREFVFANFSWQNYAREIAKMFAEVEK